MVGDIKRTCLTHSLMVGDIKGGVPICGKSKKKLIWKADFLFDMRNPGLHEYRNEGHSDGVGPEHTRS